MQVEKSSRSLLYFITRVELFLAAIAVALLVICSVTIILIRMFAHDAGAVALVDTLSQYPSHLMLISALLGGSLSLSRNEALKIDALGTLLGDTPKFYLTRSVAILGFVFYLGFLALAVGYLVVDYRPIVAFAYLPLFCLIGYKLFLACFTTRV